MSDDVVEDALIDDHNRLHEALRFCLKDFSTCQTMCARLAMEIVMANKVWVVETLHHDPKIGWVPMATWMHRAQAWEAKRYHQKRWPTERYRTVSYARSGEVKS